MEIKIYNDKKETFQSFEASVNKNFSMESAYGECYIYALGASVIDAKESLKKLAQIILKELQELLK